MEYLEIETEIEGIAESRELSNEELIRYLLRLAVKTNFQGIPKADEEYRVKVEDVLVNYLFAEGEILL